MRITTTSKIFLLLIRTKTTIWLIYKRDGANEDTKRDYIGEGFAFIIVSFPSFLPAF